jgi:ATP-dependent Lon protease
MPKKNQNDLNEIPPRLRKGLKFVLAERMGEVLDVALLPAPPKNKTKRKVTSLPVQSSTQPPA